MSSGREDRSDNGFCFKIDPSERKISLFCEPKQNTWLEKSFISLWSKSRVAVPSHPLAPVMISFSFSKLKLFFRDYQKVGW